MRLHIYFSLLLCLFSFAEALSGPKDHNSTATRVKPSSLNFYLGQGVHNYLDQISKDISQGDMVFAPTYIVTLSYSKTLYDVNEHFKMGFETDVGKHFGLQENGEVGVLWLFMLKAIFPANPYVEMDVIYGEGLSYAIGTPYFEDGPKNEPDKRYPFQSFLIFDFDLYLSRYPKTHLFYRVHHRSGVYGLITPEQVGSNFIGFGIKHIF